MNELGDNNDPSDTPSILRNLKLKNINRLVLGHLNINSLAGKFDQLKALIKRNIDILVLAETKIDSSFSNAQFRIDGFSILFRLDRNRFGGGVPIYVREDIPCKELTQDKLPENIEGNRNKFEKTKVFTIWRLSLSKRRSRILFKTREFRH